MDFVKLAEYTIKNEINMADEKDKFTTINGVKIKAEITEDDKTIFIRMSFTNKIQSYEQVKHLLLYYFGLIEYKKLERNKETIIQ